MRHCQTHLESDGRSSPVQGLACKLRRKLRYFQENGWYSCNGCGDFHKRIHAPEIRLLLQTQI